MSRLLATDEQLIAYWAQLYHNNEPTRRGSRGDDGPPRVLIYLDLHSEAARENWRRLTRLYIWLTRMQGISSSEMAEFHLCLSVRDTEDEAIPMEQRRFSWVPIPFDSEEEVYPWQR